MSPEAEDLNTLLQPFSEMIDLLIPLAGCVVLLIFAKALWKAHRELGPLQHRVEETKGNLEGVQLRALDTADALMTDIFNFQSHEGSMIYTYLDMIGKGAEAGIEGNRLLAMMQRIAAPATQATPLYQIKMNDITQLGREFQEKLEIYNAAIRVLKDRKHEFPANIFSTRFFNMPNEMFLSGAERILLPPRLLATHKEHLRQLTAISTKGRRNAEEE